MLEIVRARVLHRMPDRAEVVDQDVPIDTEPFPDQRRPDDPGIVGQLDHLRPDRRGDRDRGGAGQGAPGEPPEMRPGELQAAMLGRLQRHRRVQPDDATVLDRRDGEAGMRTADVGGDQLGRHSSQGAQ